jgi:hypothetical protein
LVIDEIDIYPVGVLDTIQTSIKYLRAGRIEPARAKIRSQIKYLKTMLRRKNISAVKNSFNGYLAEPKNWPEGLTRCGTGWTKKRALKSLNRRMSREIKHDSVRH